MNAKKIFSKIAKKRIKINPYTQAAQITFAKWAGMPMSFGSSSAESEDGTTVNTTRHTRAMAVSEINATLLLKMGILWVESLV